MSGKRNWSGKGKSSRASRSGGAKNDQNDPNGSEKSGRIIKSGRGEDGSSAWTNLG